MIQYEYIVLPTEQVLWGPANIPYEQRLAWGLNRLGRRGWRQAGISDNRMIGGQELWVFSRRMHQRWSNPEREHHGDSPDETRGAAEVCDVPDPTQEGA